MDLKPPTIFNYDSIKADISRISAVLKNEKDDDYPENPDIQSADQSNDGETTEPPLEHNSESVAGGNVGDYVSTKLLTDGGASDENFDAALHNCAILKDWIIKSLHKLDNMVNEIDQKQNFLTRKLEVATKLEYEEKKKIKYYKPINLFATPYFRDVRGSVPSPNEDSIMKRSNGDVDAYTAPPRPWTAPERRYLREAVVECARRQELEPLIASREYYKNKLEHGIISDEQVADIEEKLQTIVEEIESIGTKSDEELLQLDRSLDWMRIAASLPDITRTPDQCERMWRNFVHSSINKRKWTEEEDNELRKIAEKYECRDWEQIARELTLSKRTAIQCLQRYQSALNPSMLKSMWTKEDDEELLRVVESCRNGTYIPWNQVSYHIDGRRRLQIVNRWTRSIAPFLKKVPWSPEEDAILLAAVDRYGYKWAKIQGLLPGRSNFSCRERYTNVLAPGVIVGNWTHEEDRLLIKLARQHPEGKWSKIAEHFQGRTDNMCLQRVTRIRKHHPHLFDPDIPFSEIEKELETQELFTPTHNCKALNTNRENIRLAAEESLAKTIMKFRGYQTIEEAKEALKDMKASRQFLVELSNELLREEGENAHLRKTQKQTKKRNRKERKKAVRKRKTAVQSKGPRKRKRTSKKSELFTDETDTETDVMSIHDEEDEEEFSERRGESEEEFYTQERRTTERRERTEEDDRVDTELDTLFIPMLLYGLRHVKKSRSVCQSARQVLEHRMLKSSLHKAMHCDPCEVSDDDDEFREGTKIRGVDYANTLPPVIKNFVFDSPAENEVPVFPPNRLTLETFKRLLISNRQLNYFLSQIPYQDTHIISLISSQEIYTLVCTSCYKSGNFASQSDVVVNDPGFSHDWSAGVNKVENPAESTNSSELCNGDLSSEVVSVTPCAECERLNILRRDYHLLRKRLFSLFFWPSLLTMTEPTDEQKISICGQEVTTKTYESKTPMKQSVGKKRQRSTSRPRRPQSDNEQVTEVAAKTPPAKKRKCSPKSKQIKKEKVVEGKSEEASPYATRKSRRHCR